MSILSVRCQSLALGGVRRRDLFMVPRYGPKYLAGVGGANPLKG